MGLLEDTKDTEIIESSSLSVKQSALEQICHQLQGMYNKINGFIVARQGNAAATYMRVMDEELDTMNLSPTVIEHAISTLCWYPQQNDADREKNAFRSATGSFITKLLTKSYEQGNTTFDLDLSRVYTKLDPLKGTPEHPIRLRIKGEFQGLCSSQYIHLTIDSAVEKVANHVDHSLVVFNRETVFCGIGASDSTLVFNHKTRLSARDLSDCTVKFNWSIMDEGHVSKRNRCCYCMAAGAVYVNTVEDFERLKTFPLSRTKLYLCGADNTPQIVHHMPFRDLNDISYEPSPS